MKTLKTRNKINYSILLLLTGVMTVLAILCRFEPHTFRAKADEPRLEGFSLAELDHYLEVSFIRSTEHKTLIWAPEIIFNPSAKFLDKVHNGDKCFVEITNEFGEHARVTYMYETEDDVHRLYDCYGTWEWLDFINDEIWTIDILDYSHNPTDAPPDITITDIIEVSGVYALPYTKYHQVSTLPEALENEVLSPIVQEAVVEMISAAFRGEDIAAYSKICEINDDSTITWTQGAYGEQIIVPLGFKDGVIDLWNKGKDKVQELVAAVPVWVPGAVVTGIGVVTGQPVIIGAGVGMLGGGLYMKSKFGVDNLGDLVNFIEDTFFGDESNTPNNTIQDATETTEDAIKALGDRIEFDTTDEETSEENVLKLVFRGVSDDGEGGLVYSDPQYIKDKSGRQLYYNRKTRYIGNTKYCILDYTDMSFVRFTTDKKITTDSGNTMQIKQYTFSKDTDEYGYFGVMPKPPEDVFWVLFSGNNMSAVSFFDKNELLFQIRYKSFGIKANIDDYMISINDVNGQSNADKNSKAWRETLDRIAKKVGSWFGIDNLNWRTMLIVGGIILGVAVILIIILIVLGVKIAGKIVG